MIINSNNIISIIIDNADDRLYYVKEIYNYTGSEYLFRFELDKKDIFGRNKYLNIICYKKPEIDSIPFLIEINIPSIWNYVCSNNFIRVTDNKELGKKLCEKYEQYKYRKGQNVVYKIFKLLKGE